MGVLAATVALVTALLIVGHWLALTWPALAYRPEIARPLRLERPDSFGTWLGTLLLAASSITALLVYQLRRHRADDYKGHYRLWRPTIVLLMIASIDSVVGLLDWSGSVLDATLGQRAALSGGDWVRLLLAVGGVSFGLRMIVEVRRSPTAVIALAVALLAFVFPAAVRWRIVSVQSPWSWTLLASAPLIGRSGLWIGLVAYLRVLYREVRRIDQDEETWRDRLRQWRQRRVDQAADRQTEQAAAPRKPKAAAAVRPADRPATDRPAPDPATTDEAADAPEVAVAERPAARRLRLWPFGRSQAAATSGNGVAKPSSERAAKRAAEQRQRQAEQDIPKATPADARSDADGTEQAAGKQRRRLWPWPRRRDASAGDAAAEPSKADGQPAAKKQTPPPAVEPSSADGPQPRRGLSRLGLPGWLRLRRGASAASEAAAPHPDPPGGKRSAPADRPVQSQRPPQPSAASVPAASRADRGQRDDADDEEDGDDGTDWSSMSKAERRRLKRQQKRDGRAA